MIIDETNDDMFNILENEEEIENVKKFTADFETSTWEENKTHVWAWAVSEIRKR